MRECGEIQRFWCFHEFLLEKYHEWFNYWNPKHIWSWSCELFRKLRLSDFGRNHLWNEFITSSSWFSFWKHKSVTIGSWTRFTMVRYRSDRRSCTNYIRCNRSHGSYRNGSHRTNRVNRTYRSYWSYWNRSYGTNRVNRVNRCYRIYWSNWTYGTIRVNWVNRTNRCSRRPLFDHYRFIYSIANLRWFYWTHDSRNSVGICSWELYNSNRRFSTSHEFVWRSC